MLSRLVALKARRLERCPSLHNRMRLRKSGKGLFPKPAIG